MSGASGTNDRMEIPVTTDGASTDTEVREKLTEILANTTIGLATSKDGLNWCSNAFFAQLDDDPFRLTLILESRGRTLEQLRVNPSVGVNIVPGGFLDPFAQGLGTATVREASEREETFDALRRKEPQVEQFLATPVEALVLDIDWWRVTYAGNGWLPGRILQRIPAS